MMSQAASESEANHDGSEALKAFLVQKSRESLRFSHLMFWCILSSMDDTQSIQMSQHKNKKVWQVLNQLMTSHDDHDSLEAGTDEFFKSFQKLPRKKSMND